MDCQISIRAVVSLGMLLMGLTVAGLPLRGARAGDLRPSAGAAPAVGDGRARVFESDARTWGSLRGRFAYYGSPPEVRFLALSRHDAEMCGANRIADESLVVDRETRGIKNVVVYARKVSRVHPSAEGGNRHPVMLEQKQCVFVPHVLALGQDQPLRIASRDPIPHICLMRPPRDRELNVLLSPGGEIEHRFARPEYVPFPVTCSLHPWMSAYVLVRGIPYFAVTGADGTFEIVNLPADELIEMQVWHERAIGGPGGLVARSEWTKGRFAVTIPPGGAKDLGTVEVFPSAFDGQASRTVDASNVRSPRRAR